MIIPNTTWGGARKETTGAYRFGRNNTVLTISLDDVVEDDISTDELLQLLATRGIITKPTEWRVEEIRDTEGRTYTDDCFTTVIFIRTPTP